MWISVSHVNVGSSAIFREVADLPYASPTTRLSSVFQCDVTITVERQTHSMLSDDPLQKSIHCECCRGYNTDAIDTSHTVIEAENQQQKGYVTVATANLI